MDLHFDFLISYYCPDSTAFGSRARIQCVYLNLYRCTPMFEFVVHFILFHLILHVQLGWILYDFNFISNINYLLEYFYCCTCVPLKLIKWSVSYRCENESLSIKFDLSVTGSHLSCALHRPLGDQYIRLNARHCDKVRRFIFGIFLILNRCYIGDNNL